MINKKLETYYAAIGKRYVEYVENLTTDTTFDVSDILESMKEDLDRKAKAEAAIAEKERSLKDAEAAKAKSMAQEKFDREKKKRERALAMDIITVDEYNEKLAAAQKKLDNYEILKRYEMQLAMQIITKEEYDEKVNEILK